MIQYLPAAIMFLITVGVVALLLWPATYDQPSKVVNFYWVGVWVLLAVITSISGGSETVRMAGLDTGDLVPRLQFSGTICFVIFVMFGWARLSGLAVLTGLRRLTR